MFIAAGLIFSSMATDGGSNGAGISSESILDSLGTDILISLPLFYMGERCRLERERLLSGLPLLPAFKARTA